MGRSPSSDDKGLKKGPWTQEEDEKLTSYIEKHGLGSWTSLPKRANLNRCGKSCRLRWTNYLRPDIKRGKFSEEEEQLIIKLHSVLGNKWSRIATNLPGRTDNEIKNYWNTHLRKKLLQMGIDPITHRPRNDLNLLSQLLSLPINSTSTTTIMNNYPNFDINALSLQYSNAAELAKLQVLQNIIQLLSTSSNPSNNIAHNSTAVLGLSPMMNTAQGFNEVLGGEFVSEGSNYNLQEIMEMENKLPGLVSVSSMETLSVNENMTSDPNSTHGSFQNLPDYDFLDGCEKLMMDDGTSDLFWKDLLS